MTTLTRVIRARRIAFALALPLICLFMVAGAMALGGSQSLSSDYGIRVGASPSQARRM